MAKLKMPSDAAKALTVPERLLLLCVASAIDFKHAKIAEKVVTEVVVKGLIERDAAGHLALTDRGRAATMLLGGLSGSVHAQQVPNMTFFVTSTPIGKGGDLGGLEGADAHCQELAAAVGAGNKIWRAYLSSTEPPNGKAVNARDRIGNGPWQNSKGVVIAQNVDDLHSNNNKLTRETALTERGNMISGVGYVPVWHDILTGSDRDGRAFPGNINMTCNNWTSSDLGKAMLGHSDRTGLADNEWAHSWNSTHQSRGCSNADFAATGGNGLLYCFAQ